MLKSTVLLKKSWRDLSKRKARTIFTIITIALGVAGMSLFAVAPLADQGVMEQMGSENIYNLQLSVHDVPLNESQLSALGSLENVNALTVKTMYYTRMYIGERRNDVIFIGIPDFENQVVDVITLESGTLPDPDPNPDSDSDSLEILTERSNSINGVFSGKRGDTIRVIDYAGREINLTITGEAKSLIYAGATYSGYAVFYTSVATVQALGNLTGFNSLSFDLEKTDDEAVEQTLTAVQTYLIDNTSVTALAALPDIRADDEWGGKEMLGQLTSMMYVLTLLAIFCSVFLISNTMNTIISEQKREIAQMKALGASKAKIMRSYLTTSVIMGVIGATVGAVLGIFVAYGVLATLGAPFGFGGMLMIHVPTVIISLGAGIGIVILASLPALVRATKVVTREGLDGHGISASFGKGAYDRALLKLRRMPRTMVMGLRNSARKKGRSVATIVQVAIAVGIFLGLVSFGYSLTVAVSDAYADFTWDIWTIGQDTAGKILTEDMVASLETIEGVETIEPFVQTNVKINDREVYAMGYLYNTTAYDYRTNHAEGRWFSAEEEATHARVMVVMEALAKFEDLAVGDEIPVLTATGEYTFEVIGIDRGIINNGQTIMVPLTTLQDVLQKNNTVSGFFVRTSTNDHGEIDRISTTIEDELLKDGYVVNNEIKYVMEERNIQANQSIIDLFLVISIIIVMISLVGLMSTLTMNVLERTKEIGMMRCIGSRARDIRRVFSSEGVFLALIGWLVGIPTGYLIGTIVTKMINAQMKLNIHFFFPAEYILWAFIIAIVGTFVIIQAPLWRAVKFKPGDALRYE